MITLSRLERAVFITTSKYTYGHSNFHKGAKSMSKPKCRLTGEDGNAFAIMGRVIKSLRSAGQGHLVKEFQDKAMSGDYNHLIATCLDYVEDAGTEHDSEDQA